MITYARGLLCCDGREISVQELVDIANSGRAVVQVSAKDFIKMAGKDPDAIGIPRYYAVWPNADGRDTSGETE